MTQNALTSSVPMFNVQVGALYLAYFDRLPDAEGMSYWSEKLQRGATITTLAEEFYAQEENLIRQEPSSWMNEHRNFVSSLYRTGLGREPDWDGQGYWVEKGLQSSQQELAQMAYTIQGGALAAGGRDAAYVQNRLAFSEYAFAEVVQGSSLSGLNQQFHFSRLQALLGKVNEDWVSLLDAYANVSLKTGSVHAIGEKVRVGTGLDDVLRVEGGDAALKSGFQLAGGEGNDLIAGGQGNDLLHGGAGSDTMAGGAGDDIYYIDHSGDVVLEQVGGGRDRINSTIDYQLGDQQEELVLVGSTAHYGRGNALDNHLADTVARGYSGDEFTLIWRQQTLDGGAGNDTLVSHEGSDLLIGGQGDDAYFVYNTGFSGNEASILEHQAGGIDTIYFGGWYHTIDPFVENIVALPEGGNGLINGGMYGVHLYGNAQNNLVKGWDKDDRLDGDAADDLLYGGLGNDHLLTNLGRDTLQGGGGDDLLEIRANVTGDGKNVSDGGDVLTGGAGRDTFRLGDVTRGIQGNVDAGQDLTIILGGDTEFALGTSILKVLAGALTLAGSAKDTNQNQLSLQGQLFPGTVIELRVDGEVTLIGVDGREVAPSLLFLDLPNVPTPSPDFSALMGEAAMCSITDFKSGEDELDFMPLIQNRFLNGRLDFVGNAANFDDSQSLLARKVTGSHDIAAVFNQQSQRLYLDINGDDRIDDHDFFLELVGVTQLGIGDFVTEG